MLDKERVSTPAWLNYQKYGTFAHIFEGQPDSELLQRLLKSGDKQRNAEISHTKKGLAKAERGTAVVLPRRKQALS